MGFASLLLAVVVVVTLMVPAVTSLNCPHDSDVKFFKALTSATELTAESEVPTVSRMVKDLRQAPAEIQQAVDEKMLKDIDPGVSNKPAGAPSAAEIGNNFFAFSYSDFCCPKPEYKCTSKHVTIRYIRYYGKHCYVIHGYPLKPYFIQCTCDTCIRHGYCPLVGKCVETDYKYNYVLVYCPHHYYNKYVKLLIRVPTRCDCLSGCNKQYGMQYPRNLPGFTPGNNPGFFPGNNPGFAPENNPGFNAGLQFGYGSNQGYHSQQSLVDPTGQQSLPPMGRFPHKGLPHKGPFTPNQNPSGFDSTGEFSPRFSSFIPPVRGTPGPLSAGSGLSGGLTPPNFGLPALYHSLNGPPALPPPNIGPPALSPPNIGLPALSPPTSGPPELPQPPPLNGPPDLPPPRFVGKVPPKLIGRDRPTPESPGDAQTRPTEGRRGPADSPSQRRLPAPPVKKSSRPRPTRRRRQQF